MLIANGEKRPDYTEPIKSLANGQILSYNVNFVLCIIYKIYKKLYFALRNHVYYNLNNNTDKNFCIIQQTGIKKMVWNFHVFQVYVISIFVMWFYLV